MSSLKFIMDVDVDHDDPHRENKRSGPSFATTSGTRVPDPSAYERQASTSGQGTHDTTSPPLIPVTRTILPTATTATTRSYTTPTAISAIIDGPPPSLPPPRTQLVTITLPSRQSSAETGTHQAGSVETQSGHPEATSLSARPAALRRHSTTSASTMDQHGYSPLSPMRLGARGGTGRAASLGGFVDSTGQTSNIANRPLVPQTHLESPIRLTPITGRISRARKGQPVHVCDICRPAKTFTRAEHLRRHQLGHGTPQFPCLVPGCDRAFHRADLLARHQQKHQEGDSTPAPSRNDRRRDESPTGGSGRRPPAYPGNTPNMALRPHEGPSSGASENTSGSGSGPGAPTPADMPSTPNISHALQRQAFGSSPARNPSSQVSPHDVSRRSFSLEAAGSRRISQDFANTHNSAYTLSPSALNNPTIRYPIISTTFDPVPSQISFNTVSYQSPREGRQLCVVTEGLSGPSSLHVPDAGIPDLSLSPMYQSSTDGSTYSTPSDPRALHAPWAVPRHSSPPPYAGLSVETTSSEAWTAPYVYSHGPHSPSSIVSPPIFSAFSDFQSYGFIEDPIASSYQVMDQADHLHLAMDENSTSSPSFSRGNGNQGDSMPAGIGMRNRSLLGGPLVAPAPVLPTDHMGMSSGLVRQKQTMTVAPSPSITATSGGGFSSSHGSGFGFGGGDDSITGSSGFANSQIQSGCTNVPVSLTSPFLRHVQNAMPTYEDVYWDRLDPEYPFVHRRMSDEAGEDVLRSAMAAVGAQCLDGLEHRARSGILHKHAWDEVRRIPQWNLQIMQAILLCEYLARFRGKRLAMQPSKLFESLYSRVSHSGFLRPSLGRRADTTLGFSTARLSSSYSLSSSPFSTASCSSWYSDSSDTPTSLHPLDFRRESAASFPSLASSFSSTSSISSVPSYFPAEHSAVQPFVKSSTFPASFTPGKRCSDQFQAINQVHSFFDVALTAQSNPNLTAQQRWRNWLVKESYRRLASSCFVLDVHASLYQQVSRTRDFNMLEPGSAPPLTFTGPSQALWDASSAEEWDGILNTNPAAGTPIPMLPSEAVATMLPDDGSALATSRGPSQRSFDHFMILTTETLRLPKRDLGSGKNYGNPTEQPGGISLPLAEATSDWRMVGQTSLAPGSDHFTTHLGSYSAAFQVEERIARLFRYSPIANTYLALHHTPLHELLAVTGAPGNPHHKNLPYQQGRVRLWTAPLVALDSSFSNTTGQFDKMASRAVVYAARALTEFLSTPSAGRATIATFTDYWGIYVCTLICWACGTRAAAAADGSNGGNFTASSEQDAREWLHLASSLQPEDGAAVSTLVKDGRWTGAIGLARRQIDQDCGASSSGNVMSDVLGVLTRLDGDQRKRF